MNNAGKKSTAKLQSDKSANIFAYIWIVVFVIFNVVQLVCGMAWGNPAYDWRMQTISDLGRTTAPFSLIMNYAFILQGAAFIIGIWGMKSLWRKSIITSPARTLLTLAGAGYIVIGFFPLNVAQSTHLLFGAAPIMLFGAIGLVVSCVAMDQDRFGMLWIGTALLGIGSLLCGFLYFIEIYLGLGKGIMERIWVNIPLVWSVLVALSILYGKAAQSKNKAPAPH